jgi:hypothetical protein
LVSWYLPPVRVMVLAIGLVTLPISEVACTVAVTGVKVSPGSMLPWMEAGNPVITALTPPVAASVSAVTGFAPAWLAAPGYHTVLYPVALKRSR